MLLPSISEHHFHSLVASPISIEDTSLHTTIVRDGELLLIARRRTLIRFLSRCLCVYVPHVTPSLALVSSIDPPLWYRTRYSIIPSRAEGGREGGRGGNHCGWVFSVHKVSVVRYTQ